MEVALRSSGVSEEAILQLLDLSEQLNRQFLIQREERKQLECEVKILNGEAGLCAVVRNVEGVNVNSMDMGIDSFGHLVFYAQGKELDAFAVDICFDQREKDICIPEKTSFLSDILQHQNGLALVGFGEPLSGKSRLLFGNESSPFDHALVPSLVESLLSAERLSDRFREMKVKVLEFNTGSVRSLLSRHASIADSLSIVSLEQFQAVFLPLISKATPHWHVFVEIQFLFLSDEDKIVTRSLTAFELSQPLEFNTLFRDYFCQFFPQLRSRCPAGRPVTLFTVLETVYYHSYLCAFCTLDSSRPFISYLSLKSLQQFLSCGFSPNSEDAPEVPPLDDIFLCEREQIQGDFLASFPGARSLRSRLHSSRNGFAIPMCRSLTKLPSIAIREAAVCTTSLAPKAICTTPPTSKAVCGSDPADSTIFLSASPVSTDSSKLAPSLLSGPDQELEPAMEPAEEAVPDPKQQALTSISVLPCERFLFLESPICFEHKTVVMEEGDSPSHLHCAPALSVDVLDNQSTDEEEHYYRDETDDDGDDLADLRYFPGREGADCEEEGERESGHVLEGVLIEDPDFDFGSSSERSPPPPSPPSPPAERPLEEKPTEEETSSG